MGSGNGKHELVLKTVYDQITCSRGFCTLEKKGKWGVYNGFSEKEVLPVEYEHIELDTTGKHYTDNALVKKSGKVGMYNIIYDYWILEPLYDTIIRRDRIYITYLNGKAGTFTMCTTLMKNHATHLLLFPRGYTGTSPSRIRRQTC